MKPTNIRYVECRVGLVPWALKAPRLPVGCLACPRARGFRRGIARDDHHRWPRIDRCRRPQHIEAAQMCAGRGLPNPAGAAGKVETLAPEEKVSTSKPAALEAAQRLQNRPLIVDDGHERDID